MKPSGGSWRRSTPVAIGSSVYVPLANPLLIDECFRQLVLTAAAIDDPFEASLFLLAQLPYLQPSLDGNKRAARLAANLPFVMDIGGSTVRVSLAEVGLSGKAPDLEVLAAAGNAEAQRLYDVAGTHLCLAIANQVTVLNPAVLVLGGGVLMRTPKLLSRIVETVGRRTGAAARKAVRIERAMLGDGSGIVGAALMAAETPR